MSEAKIPNRDQMTGRWRRKIIYNNEPEIEKECPLSDITWCTKWVATESPNYRTVHEITPETIQNAYAAGYTRDDIEKSTGFKVPDLHRLEIRNSPHAPMKYLDIGNYSFHGEKAKIAHLYATMHTVCTDESQLDHMFELGTLRDDSFHVKRSTIKQSRKNMNARSEQTVVDVNDVHQILVQAKRVKLKRNNTLEFDNGDPRDRYICRFTTKEGGPIDIDDVWPAKDGLASIIEHKQVYGAGEIGRVTAVVTHFTIGTWEQNEDVDDESIVDEQKNADRQFRNEKTKHGLVAVRQALHNSCQDHFISVPETIDMSNATPLGLNDSFWAHLRNHNINLNDTPLMQFVNRRKINQFEDSEKPPPYGRITTKFRPAQSDALELMFRDDRLRSGIYILPCGGGKTLLGIAAAVRSGSKHVLILVPNTTIEDQWKKRLYDRANVRAKTLNEVGTLTKEKLNENPVVAVVSWNMLAWGGCKEDTKENEALAGTRINGRKIAAVENILFCFWDLIIIDEVHNIRSPQNQCLLSKLSYNTMIGLTATASKNEDFPWHVDVAPVMFETAWPLNHASTINIHCDPFGNYEAAFEAATRGRTKSTIEGNTTSHTSNIHETMRNILPTYATDYKKMLDFNPIKMEKVAQLIEYHEAENHPIIVFANFIPHIEILQRRFVKLPLLGKHEHFGDYLRTAVEKYILNVRNEYIEPFGDTFGGDDYEGDSEDRGWENRFMEQWNPEVWSDDIRSTLMNLCPNVPFDANFGNHYVSRMHERMYEELDAINDILGDEVSLSTVQTVPDRTWARLFYLFDTPRWAMFGKTGSEYPYNMGREHRYRIYEKFNQNRIKTLFLSRIGNEGVDLPGTRVIIVINGLGKRETEDAQRFGRALRGDEGTRYFYSVFTDTGHDDVLNSERNDAMEREKFLNARGYFFDEQKYDIPADHEWIPRDADNIPIAYPRFFITPEFLGQRPTQIWLQAGDVNVKEKLTLNHAEGQCTYLRSQIESDSNFNMASYIAKEFGYNLTERLLRRQ